jgi:hypothetical protein
MAGFPPDVAAVSFGFPAERARALGADAVIDDFEALIGVLETL